MQKNILIIALVSFILSACTTGEASNGIQARVVIPLLQECEKTVTTYLESIPDMIGISYSIVRLDYEMRAFPTLSGYIELKSARHNKEQLMTTANTFILSCYPESRTTIDKTQGDVGEALINALQMNKRLGIDKNYIVDGKDKIDIYVNRQ